MQKIITICGTRPEWIRLSIIIKKLDLLLGTNHILVHTGQNYDPNLSDIFFKELEIRQPNYFMNARGSFGEQIGIIMKETEKILNITKPDKMLILGDTNTDLSGYIAERLQIPVYHMEAGNRAYDKELPEEINRKLIDHISSYNFPYTQRSRENLLREGINPQTIYVSGNPIWEVISYYKHEINNRQILNTLKLTKQNYILVTLHRSNNVDNLERFEQILNGLNLIANTGIELIVSTHPRTGDKLNQINIKLNNNIKFLEPFGFFDFIKLEKNAKCILTDSGTVQEEACILRIPCVVIRKSTERPETIECEATILAGTETQNILNSYKYAIKMNTNWQIPEEYLYTNVSDRMINYLIGGI
jgi:UDP-N-acetylglucosamine 2-epimerase (non-hydrolysing)